MATPPRTRFARTVWKRLSWGGTSGAKRAPRRTSRKLSRAAAFCWVAVLASCSNSTVTDDGSLVPTALLVDPRDFLGSQVCLDASGAVRSYQATLVDVTEDLDQPFALPSSEVISCKSPAYFGHVTPGRRYVAHIDAFGEAGLRAQSPGVRLVVDADGQVIEPRFFSVCRGEDGVSYGGSSGGGGAAGSPGSNALGVEALLNSNVYVRGCTPLSGSGSLGPTGISIRLEGSLLQLRCGNKPGNIERFVVRPTGAPPHAGNGGAGGLGGAGGSSGEPGSETGAKCDQTVTVTGLLSGLRVSYEVEAFEVGQSTPTYGTTCRALTVAGVVVPARCDGLAPL